MTRPVLSLRDVGVVYPGPPPVTALDGVSLDILPGQMVAIVGPSGSGKSTLLHTMGTLERATRGTVELAGRDIGGMRPAELAGYRAWRIGFVFQSFYLLDGVTVAENVETGLLYRGESRRRRRLAALEALARVGLGSRATHLPNQLSGGERQRVAIARAVVGEPAIVLADEPTGNLDTANGEAILELLLGLNEEGATIALITHNDEIAAALPRRLVIRDGRLLEEDHAR